MLPVESQDLLLAPLAAESRELLGDCFVAHDSGLQACGVEIHFDLTVTEPASDEETVIGRAPHEDLLSDQILDVVFTD
jgi:hypothetical protein